MMGKEQIVRCLAYLDYAGLHATMVMLRNFGGITKSFYDSPQSCPTYAIKCFSQVHKRYSLIVLLLELFFELSDDKHHVTGNFAGCKPL